MKNLPVLTILLAALLLTGCSNLINSGENTTTIRASDTIISEERSVSDITGIDFSAIGQVILTQGDQESLTIQGSDNIVPLIKTPVRDGVLYIETDEPLSISGMDNKNMLILTITVKDLNKMAVSGLGDIQMDSLNTADLTMTVSGGGRLVLGQLTAENLTVSVSGLGDVDIAGEVLSAKIEIPGGGSIQAPDLKIGTADVNISGLGDATLWVTDRLTGNISGGGSVSYYGDPQVDTNVSGLGDFNPKGSK